MTTALMTFFLSSGLPFLTDARNDSPIDAAGILLSLEPIIVTAIMYRFLAPLLSQQLRVAATGRQVEIFYLIPLLPPLALFDMMIEFS